MKAARLYEKDHLVIDDVPVPEVGPGDILLRIKAGQICGTDVRMYRNGREGVSPNRPLIIGHEISGIIEATGRDIDSYKPGMRVAVAPNYGCGVCDLCVSGNNQLCRNSEALGVTRDGGFAEYMCIPAPAVRQGCVSVIPDEVRFQDAALAEPLSCVYNAFERNAPRPGDTVLIIGAGPIGLMHAKMYLAAGVGRVFVNDVNEKRLKLCRNIEPEIVPVFGGGPESRNADGGDSVVNTLGASDLETIIEEYTGGKGVDICITACPAPAAQQTALRVTGTNGKVMFFGGLPKDRENVVLNTNLIHYKQLSISGTTRQSLGQFRRVLRLIETNRISLEGLVSDVHPLEDVRTALRKAIDGEGLKHGVGMGGPE